MDLIALVSIPEKFAAYEGLLVGLGTFLAVVLGSMLGQLVAQPGFRKFAAFFGVKRAVDEEQNQRLEKIETTLGTVVEKLDQVVDTSTGNGVLIEAQAFQLQALQKAQWEANDDVHVVMDMLDGMSTSEIQQRRDQRRRRREIEVIEGGNQGGNTL